MTTTANNIATFGELHRLRTEALQAAALAKKAADSVDHLVGAEQILAARDQVAADRSAVAGMQSAVAAVRDQAIAQVAALTLARAEISSARIEIAATRQGTEAEAELVIAARSAVEIAAGQVAADRAAVAADVPTVQTAAALAQSAVPAIEAALESAETAVSAAIGEVSVLRDTALGAIAAAQASAAAAQAAAEAFVDEVSGGIADINALKAGAFANRAAVQAVTVPAPVAYVELRGRTTFGDGGGGPYKRVLADPGHALAFQDGGGNWWEWDEKHDPHPTLVAFGAISDADIDEDGATIGTDCTAAFQAMLEYYSVKYATDVPAKAWRAQPDMRPGPGHFRISGSVNFFYGMRRVRMAVIDGTGCNLYCDGLNKIPFDMTECQYLEVKNFKARGDPVNTPLCFIKHGRTQGNNTAAHMRFINNTTLHSVGSSHWKIAAKWDIAAENTFEWRNYWHNDREAVFPFTADTPVGNCYGAAYDCVNFCAYDRGLPVTAIGSADGDLTFTVTGHGWAAGTIVAPSRVAVDEVVPVGGAAEFRERAYAVSVVDSNTIKLLTYRETENDYAGPALLAADYDVTDFVGFLLHKEHYASEFHGDRRCPPWTRQSQLQCRRWNIWSCEYGTAAILQGSCDHTELDGYAKSQGAGILMAAAQYYPQSAFTEMSLKLHVEPGQAPSPPDHAVRFLALDSGAQKIQVTKITFIENASNADVSLIGIYDDGLGSTHTVQFAGGSLSIGRARGTAGVESGMLDTPSKYTFDGMDIFAEGAGVVGTTYVNIAPGSFAGGKLIDSETGATRIVPERPTPIVLSGSPGFRPGGTVVDLTSTEDFTVNTIQRPRFLPDRCIIVLTNANDPATADYAITLTNAGNIITGVSPPGIVMEPGDVVTLIKLGDNFKVIAHV